VVHLLLIPVVIAAILIVFGRVTRRNVVAIAGYALLALTLVVGLLSR